MRSDEGQGKHARSEGSWRKRCALAVVLVLLALFLFIGVRELVEVWKGRTRKNFPDEGGAKPSPAEMISPIRSPTDTVAAENERRVARDSTETEEIVADTGVQTKRKGVPPAGKVPDSFAIAREETKSADSAVDISGVSHEVSDSSAPCAADTIAPWVYPDPSGGLHRRVLTVFLRTDESCRIQWRWSGESEWRDYMGEPITVDRTATLEYQGTDACGNTMEVQQEHYIIERSADSSRCPPDMEFISVSGTQFCIDRYEWPNRRGVKPSSYVSLYQAMDSCASVGKRLCSSDEWILACSGPYGWAYPYGDRFEERACVTNDTGRAASGTKVECRGYFDVYDMSGNLAEWTSTRSTANSRFYNVMGGFWESGSYSGCFEMRYSYFPQNRHNPIGFRCCADARGYSETPSGGRRRR